MIICLNTCSKDEINDKSDGTCEYHEKITCMGIEGLGVVGKIIWFMSDDGVDVVVEEEHPLFGTLNLSNGGGYRQSADCTIESCKLVSLSHREPARYCFNE